ncbi:AMP-binding protein [Altererythrobacter sp. RZ02]|uniref:AMP-binding protein n=1 Tax=Pontixanthobacter rizhaonensis TaxID=2730337 RepID=A0A848QIR3_9SPHN|nr:AMP-binding protein [Pontixanthobacter rizhaonensis]NMW30934.1 AMP-binding protein [Pontixanthobacter rizhaonensis]
MIWRGENFGVAVKAIANTVEHGRPALLHGDRMVTWQELDRQTDAIAASLIRQGLKPGDVAGQMLRNSPDYILAYFGCVKAGITPVNVNYHYKQGELRDIFTRFGLKALFVEQEFAAAAEATDTPGLDHIIIADPANANWRDMLQADGSEDFVPHQDAQALFFTATGGTTGMPKAVMWPFEEAWDAFQISQWPTGLGQPPHIAASLAEHCAIAAKIAPDGPDSPAPLLLLSPLMHGAGQFAAMIHLMRGGTLATVPASRLDANQAIDAVKQRKARSLAFVGDAFAMPLADALENRTDGKDAIKSLRLVTSSGAVFSQSVKDRLIAANPEMVIIDALGSSESAGTAVTITSAAGTSGGGNFAPMPGRDTKIFAVDVSGNHQEVQPGSDDFGILARSGPLPLGYLGEDEKNAQTFPEIGGRRWLMTGDTARYRADGSIEFQGRDNMCINTGGEKVFPEEVEAVLQGCEGVQDVRVVGIPDPRFGRKITAVIQGADAVEAELDATVRAALAGYKIPRLYVFTEQSLRLNNGKPDYKAAQALADAAIG